MDWLSYIPRFQVSYPQTVCSIQSHFSIADHTRYKWGQHWRNSVQGHFWGHFNLTCKSPLKEEGKNGDQNIQELHTPSFLKTGIAHRSFSCMNKYLLFLSYAAFPNEIISLLLTYLGYRLHCFSGTEATLEIQFPPPFPS